MNERNFEEALDRSGTNPSCRYLYKLMKGLRADSLGAARPQIAERYLRSFTDESFPDRTRRWIGLVLHRLIETSSDIVHHLASCSDGLKSIGQIILTQSEDLKLVAGMILRKMVLAGMQHALFWPTDAIPSAIANFPTHDSQVWMERFQDFLDTLHELRFMKNNDSNGPGVLYAFEITAQDGVHIVEETGLIILLVEGRNLTCIIPPSTTQIARCFDIPLAHIADAKVSKSTVQTSTGSQTEYTTAELILNLSSKSWTYLCNAKEYHAEQIVFLCRNMSDAQEAAVMVMEEKLVSNSQLLNNLGPKISASLTLDISKPSELRDEIEQTIDVQPAHGNSTEKDLKSGPTTSQTEHKKTGSIQHSETRSLADQSRKGIAPQIGSPQTKKATQSSIPKEPQLSQKSQTPTSGALSQVKKPRPPDASSNTSVLEDRANERGEFEVPSSPEMPQKSMLKKPTPKKAKKAAIATNGSREANTISHNTVSQNQEKQIAKKSKPVGAKSNVRYLLQAENTEASWLESSQLSSQQVAEETEVRQNVSHGASCILQGVSGENRNQESQKSLKSMVRNKPVKAAKGKVQSDNDSNERSVFDIPPDEPREPRKRGKRPVAKNSHSESGESTDESYESEYVEPKRKPLSSSKNASAKKVKSTPKPANCATSKAWTKKKQTKSQKAVTQPLLSTRPSLVNKLLTGTTSKAALEKQIPKHSCKVSETGDVQNDGVVTQFGPSPELPTRALSSHSKPIKASSILKHPAEASHPSTPEPKRMKVTQITPHTNEDVGEGGVNSGTRPIVDFANKPGSVCAHETGSPCPIAKFIAGKPSAKQMIKKLLDSMPAEEEADENGESGHLTHSEQASLHSKDLLRPDPRQSKIIPADVQSSSSKALPAASRAISGHAIHTVVENARASANKAKAATDPFKRLSMEQTKCPRTAFTQRLAGQTQEQAQEQILQDSHPLPATPAPRQPANANNDFDETLIGTEDVECLPTKAYQMTVASLPPPSSHSSSSATEIFEEIDAELAEEMEWEASLQPHQRAVADMLTRISRRLVRHLIDSETALRDIIADYERDGRALIAKLAEEHPIHHAAYFETIEAQRAAMGKEFREVAKRLEQARTGI